MNTKKLFKGCVLGLYGVATFALALVIDISPVAAHGERSQEPFLRMRTIQWYDVEWGEEAKGGKATKVNEVAIMKGKFHLAEDWQIGRASCRERV
jgi:methane/ammonia monooxygenase subunit B